MGIRAQVISLFFALLLCGAAFGQEGISKDVRSLNGEKFYFHTIQKGNTLYGISKMYNVDIKEILRNNPEANEGLRIDQVIKVPFKKAKVQRVEKNKLQVDGSFLIHRVVKGETLYGISKRYNVSQENILKYNPLLRDGLSPGMQLKIETLAVNKEEQDEEMKEALYVPAELDSFINHVVMAKETWYGIALKYQVNIDTLMAFNLEFRNGIKIGDVLRIPELSPKYLQEQNFGKKDSSLNSLKLDTGLTKVFLFLPFYLDDNDTSFTTKVEEGLTYKNKINPKSKLAFEFYEGVLLALDSLKKKNVQLELSVFDTKSNASFDSLIASVDFSRTDLIIGPLYRSNFDKVVAKAKPFGIPMISPVPQSNKILLDNPNVIKLSPSYASEVAYVRNYYDQKLKGSNFFLINSYKFKDMPLINLFLKEGTGTAEFDSSMMLTISEPERFDISSKLDTIQNYFYLPSTDKGYVGGLVNMLYPYSRNHPITLIGMSNWAGYDNLDINYLEQMNFHYTTEFFVDYDDPDLVDFLKKYRVSFGTEPLKYGFFGYEVMMNFVGFNTANMLQDLEKINEQGMVVKFDFRKFDFSNGVENRGLYLLRTSDFRLQKVQ